MKLVRYADRPTCWSGATTSSRDAPSRVHAPQRPGGLYWGRLYADFPDFQVALVDGDELLAEAHAVPLAVGRHRRRSTGRLGRGLRARNDLGAEPAALMALAISVSPDRQGERSPAG